MEGTTFKMEEGKEFWLGVSRIQHTSVGSQAKLIQNPSRSSLAVAAST